jgi:hypothetical protein
MLFKTSDTQVVLKEISKLQPLNYNRFKWWRRFDSKIKPLPRGAKFIDRIKNGDVVRNDRMSLSHEIKKDAAKSSLVIMGKAPDFKLTDQNNKWITNADYKGKVYVLEFFFSTCL